MSQNKTNPDRYTLLIEWSDEDQCFIGRCPELFGGGVHGSDREAVYAELCEAVQEWVGIFRKDGRALPAPLAGKDFSGKFILRIPPALHRLLAIRALVDGDSLNSFVEKKLKRAV